VKTLSEAGANLLEESNYKETVLTIAIRSFIQWIENKKEMLLIIRYFLDHPQLKQNVELICNAVQITHRKCC
jgi:hypothetical protein